MSKILSRAFTLAETLTTLTVIGIIALIVLPILNSEVDTKVLDRQKTVFNTKFEDGLHRMQIRGELAKTYASTEAFVDVMKNYFSITRVCQQGELNQCFGDKLRNGNNSYDLRNIENSNRIDIQFKNPTNVNGIVFSDGTRALIAYDTDCSIGNMYDTTIDVKRCFAMYIDVNGEQGRTALDEDVVGVNIGSIVLQQGDIGAIFQPSGFSEEQCENARAKGAPINECRPGGSDYWAYAVYRCWNEGKQLPTREQLATIANEIYDLPVGRDGTTSGLTVKNPELWAKLVSPDSGASFWSSDECNAYGSYSRVFSSSSSTGYSTARNTTYFKAFCLGDE